MSTSGSSPRLPSARPLPRFLPDGEDLAGPVEISISGPGPIMGGTAFHAHGMPYFPGQSGGPSAIEEGDHA